jgi:hypothetical protein
MKRIERKEKEYGMVSARPQEAHMTEFITQTQRPNKYNAPRKQNRVYPKKPQTADRPDPPSSTPITTPQDACNPTGYKRKV